MSICYYIPLSDVVPHFIKILDTFIKFLEFITEG